MVGTLPCRSKVRGAMTRSRGPGWHDSLTRIRLWNGVFRKVAGAPGVFSGNSNASERGGAAVRQAVAQHTPNGLRLASRPTLRAVSYRNAGKVTACTRRRSEESRSSQLNPGITCRAIVLWAVPGSARCPLRISIDGPGWPGQVCIAAGNSVDPNGCQARMEP